MPLFSNIIDKRIMEVFSVSFPMSLGTNFPLSKLPLWIRYLNLPILHTHTNTYRHIHTHTHTYSDGKKNLPSMKGTWVQSQVGKISWRREWLSTPVFWPGEFHGHRAWRATVHCWGPAPADPGYLKERWRRWPIYLNIYQRYKE